MNSITLIVKFTSIDLIGLFTVNDTIEGENKLDQSIMLVR